MIDAVFEEDLQHAISLRLGGTAQRRRPKESVTVLMCPVRPNGRFSIIDAPFLSMQVPGDDLLAMLCLPRPAAKMQPGS